MLIEAEAEHGRISLRTRIDVARAGLSQRLRDSGLQGDDRPPALQVRAGVLLVLWSWSLFVLAGIGLQKTSEQWQAAVPHAEQGLPAAAFASVVVAAAIGTAAVLIGVLLVVRPLSGFLRAGGWRQIRRPVVRAVVATGLTAVVLAGIVAWAHQLTGSERNGGDWRYGAAVAVLALSGFASVVAWAHAGVVTAWRLTLTGSTLRLEAWLAGTATVAMLVMTAATATWWISIANAAPGYFGTGIPWRMLALMLTMVASSGLATAGSLRSLRPS